LDVLPVESVLIGDLEDMERAAKATNARLILANSHAAAAAARLGTAHLRIGYPNFRHPLPSATVRQAPCFSEPLTT
jgi:nitrogenase molybdenum-iron protein NifN